MANQLYQGSNPLATTCPNVVDNLTSTSSTDALSAKQGKVLNDKIATEAYRLDLANISRVQVTKNEQDTDFYLIWRTDSNNAMQIRFNSSGIRMMKQTNGTWAEIWAITP